MNKYKLNRIAKQIGEEVGNKAIVVISNNIDVIEIQFNKGYACDSSTMEFLISIKKIYGFTHMITGVPFERSDSDKKYLTVTFIG